MSARCNNLEFLSGHFFHLLRMKIRMRVSHVEGISLSALLLYLTSLISLSIEQPG
jgi:hypothetical protein